MANSTPSYFVKPKLRSSPLPVAQRPIKTEGSLFWSLQFLFWGFVGTLIHFLSRYFFVADFSRADSLLVATTRFCVGIPVSTALGWGDNSASRFSRNRKRFLAASAGLILIAALVETSLFIFIIFLIKSYLLNYIDTRLKLITFFLHRIEFLSFWSLMFFGIFFWKRLQSVKLQMARAESALLTSELSRLQLQIHPHFLFNSLTAVLSCRHNPDDVTRVVRGLSQYLRFCLTRQEMLAPLAMEMEALQQYVVVEQYRFGETLDCQIHCTPEAAAAVVPTMIITPLLENAFKYGGQTSTDQLIVEVDCQIQVEQLIITVFNTGYWIEPTSVKEGGLGLANLKSRLALLGLADAQLKCGPFAADPLKKGVRCQLILPLHRDFQPTDQVTAESLFP